MSTLNPGLMAMPGVEKVTPNFVTPNDFTLPLRFPGLKPVGALAFQPLTFSTSVVLTGQPKSDTILLIGEYEREEPLEIQRSAVLYERHPGKKVCLFKSQ